MKPGYKQTELGVIPDDWDVKRLGQLAKIQRGASPRPIDSSVWFDNNSSIGWVRISDVTRSKMYLYETTQRLSPLGVQCSRPVAKDSLIMSICATVGRPVITKIDVCIHDGFVVFDNLHLDQLFLYYILKWIEPDWSKHGQTGSQMNLNTGLINGALIPLPPLHEQHAIATALSDVDALLESLDRLIAKKRDLKQAAMQRLLTGQTRLPGFHGDWGVKRLGELGSFTKGSGVKKDESQSGSLPCIRYGEIYTRHHNYIKGFHSFISAEVAATASLLKQGDILFAGSGETKAEIGKCVAFVDDSEAYAGGDIVILRPQGVDSLFLGFSLNTPAINRQKASRGQGDAVVHISSSALADIALNLPPVHEQTAIAEVLSDMNAELAALEQRREKTRALKQGMMQELLTGRTRLIEPESAHA